MKCSRVYNDIVIQHLALKNRKCKQGNKPSDGSRITLPFWSFLVWGLIVLPSSDTKYKTISQNLLKIKSLNTINKQHLIFWYARWSTSVLSEKDEIQRTHYKLRQYYIWAANRQNNPKTMMDRHDRNKSYILLSTYRRFLLVWIKYNIVNRASSTFTKLHSSISQRPNFSRVRVQLGYRQTKAANARKDPLLWRF